MADQGGLRRALWHLRQGGIAQLLEHRRRVRRGSYVTGRRMELFDDGDGLSFHSFEWPEAAPRRSLRVGVIADDFTRAAFAYEWVAVILKPSTWRDELDSLDLLFVESAWHGNHDTWQYQLTGSKAPSQDVRALIAACRGRGIPTVFWNKEDPTHFEDFLDSAALFDWVFTTDEAMVPAYRERLGHARVQTLPFAVQERVTNPVRRFNGEHERGIAFAGTWFAHKYPERREQMTMLFDAAIAVERALPPEAPVGAQLAERAADPQLAERAADPQLAERAADPQLAERAERVEAPFEIFSRFLGGDERYQFPEPYASRVVGSLDYDQMLSAYRAYRVFLNVNTVTDSPTMFARRLLEITACGTPVVTTPTPAIARFLGDGVAQVSDTDEATRVIARILADKDFAAAMVHRGQRELWRAHTYSHRVDQVLRAVGLEQHTIAPESVSIVMATKRPQQLDHALAQVAQQEGVSPQWLLGTHGFDVDPTLVARAREAGVDLVVVRPPDDVALGDVLNLLVERADGDVVTKMDDDDLYGPHYLADLLAVRRVSGADVVGKHERWVHLKAHDLTVVTSPGMAWRPTTFVAGPTITASRDLAREVRFPSLGRGEDTGFLKGVVDAGARIVAADPYQFVQMRLGGVGGHSWNVDDDHFLHADRRVEGLPLSMINN